MEGLRDDDQRRQSAAEPIFDATPSAPVGADWRNRKFRLLLVRLEQPFWLLLLIVAVGLLLITAPHTGDFWWSDAPRHALNGAFLLDFFRALPLDDPVGFAKRYYAQYPALSVLFYPPLFPLIEAPIYRLLGVSHFCAQLAVALHLAALATGVFLLARRAWSPALSFAAALLFIGAHEVAYWGRQVMLEIPVTAWMVWMALVYLRYLDHRQPKFLYVLALLALGALYTKQTAVFLVVAVAGLLVWETAGTILRDRHFRIAAILFPLALVPLAAMTLKFGQTNLNASAGETGRELSRLSWANWTYYLRQLPDQLGWPVLVLALLYPLAGRRHSDRSWSGPLQRLLIAWFVTGYLFFSWIALKESRHSLLILLPVVLAAVAGIVRWLPPKLASAAILIAATSQYATTVTVDRPPAITGYDQAADFVASAAPAHSLILFSGYRDGSFIFNLRARDERGELGVLRSDKLLLKVKVKRELGVEQREITPDQLATALNRYGVSYIVNEPDFWSDLKAMQVLQEVLHTPQFVKVSEIPISGNIPHADHKLEIYRNLHYTPGTAERPPLELLIIDQVI
jgi:hypothetical protein